MNEFDERKLEERIHRELQALSHLKAPKSLGPRVLAAIRAREAAPWFKRSWANWPFGLKAAFFTFGLVLLGGLVFAGTALPQLTYPTGWSLDWLSAQVSGLRPYLDVVTRITANLGSTLDAIGPNLFWYLAALGAVAYGTCIALGTLGYRLVLNKI